MQNEISEKQINLPTNPGLFYSIFDPPDTTSPKSELLDPVPKNFDASTLGPVIFSSKVQKKAQKVGFTITRYFFLFSTHIGYSKHNNPSQIKKYTDLKGLKATIAMNDGESSKSMSKKRFIIFFKSKVQTKVYIDNKNLANEWREHLRKYCILTDFGHTYTLEKILGKGAHGKVVLAVNNNSGKKYAVKIFEKIQLITRLKGFVSIINEIDILRQLSHNRIVELFEVYETVSSVYLVLEYAEGGELFCKLKGRRFYTEPQCIIILKNILEPLVYMHEKKIVHRDIKPENIVLASANNDYDVKIVDFGFSVQMSPTAVYKRCGTPGYVPPEVMSPKEGQEFTEKSDLFSVGAIFFELLTGSKLFSGSSVEELMRKNRECYIDEFKLTARNISNTAVDLLYKMLSKDPAKRISAKDALDHHFFKNVAVSTTDVPEDVENTSIGETSKYSFDLACLKELNMITKSRLTDSAGTFIITSHIPIKSQLQPLELEKLSRINLSFNSGECSPKGMYSYGTSNFTSDASSDNSEEVKDHNNIPGWNNSKIFTNHKSLKKSVGAVTPTASPFHKAAIMNNIKKNQMLEHKLSDGSPIRSESRSPDGFADYVRRSASLSPESLVTTE